MGSVKSKSEVPQSGTSNSSEPSVQLQQPAIYRIIHRMAIGQSAGIGSLYNARRDCFLETTPPNLLSRPRTSTELPHCVVINGDECKGRRLSDLMNLDRDLRLSVKLKMGPQGELFSLIDYSLKLNTLTRILYYHYVGEEKVLSNETDIIHSSIDKALLNLTVTHIVTEIKLGILVVVVLQLPFGDDAVHIDKTLKEIEKQLKENSYNFNENETSLLDRIVPTKVFSNIPDIAQLSNLTKIHQKITEIKMQASEHRLVECTLRPVASLVSLNSAEKYKYTELHSKTIDKLEQHLYKLSLITSSKISLSSDVKQSLENRFKNQYHEVQQQISNTTDKKNKRLGELRDIVDKMRSGASQAHIVVEMQNDIYENELQNEITIINERLAVLQDKIHLIEVCEKNRVDYCNVKTIVQDNNDDFETIKQQLWKKDKQQRIFCFDDKLANPSSSQWNDFYRKLIDERTSHPQLKLVYADFTFCSYHLIQMEVLPSEDSSKQKNKSREEPASLTAAPAAKKKCSDASNPPPNNIINVLLLGESGVGKSTFVNAIVNYLRFESLREARSGQPIVLMPVSFLMTTGHNFEERIVQFGKEDPNENHHHPGQSVTQRCRSYIFAIGTQTKLRLIDTPGMGDTREVDQDDLNMQQILSFINNLSHLNAICILLKPNESKLNVVFRSYFTRLLGFLGENVRNNIIFCFTNTRGTFFAPGDTGPLLRQMLQSHSIKDIPFKKTNTFCFDNEAFRYLVARLNGIKFDDYQKDEYKRSWAASVAESNRLLQHICSQLKPYSQEEWQSVEHAQFQITQLVRPMLETTRNVFRNIILQKEKSSKLPIKLLPRELSRSSIICSSCKPTPQNCSDFWVLPDILHIISDKCRDCQCSRKRHINVDYKLEYGQSDDAKRQSYSTMKLNLEQLKKTILDLAHFFTYVVPHSEQADPIMSSLTRMITQENEICSLKGMQCLNSKLCNELDRLKGNYQQKRNAPMSNENSNNLSIIYELIKSISEIDSIREQINAIKLFHQNSMKQQEKDIV